jgi:hypothetical protein
MTGLLANAWLPFALASIASTGQWARDLSPFILSPAVIGKPGFIHAVVRGVEGRDR